MCLWTGWIFIGGKKRLRGWGRGVVMRKKKEKVFSEGIQVRVPKEVKEDLAEICRIHKLTESQAVRVALNVYISRLKNW